MQGADAVVCLSAEQGRGPGIPQAAGVAAEGAEGEAIRVAREEAG